MDLDISKLKQFVLTNDDYRTKLGMPKSGENADVYFLDNAAVKCERTNKTQRPTVEKYIERSQLGVKRGINIVPILDYAEKQEKYRTEFKFDNCSLTTFSFMPKVDGLVIGEDGSLDKLLALGVNGFKKFFEDYIDLHAIGFFTDTNPKNFIIGDKCISFIDLYVDKEIKGAIEPDDLHIFLKGAMNIILLKYKSQELRHNITRASCKFLDDRGL